MKIQSHTGEMVEARVGMVCKRIIPSHEIDYPAIETVTITDTTLDFVEVDNSCRMDSNCIDELTMLHCPFQVGDEVEYHCERSWIKSIYTETLAFANKNIRHANPALRDAPEYKA